MNATIEDPFEFITAAIYENQLNFERIEKALMLDEYYYLLENSKEMVYESNIITSFFGKILQAIKSIWEKIKEFFKSIFSKEKQVTEANKKAAEKVKKNPQLAETAKKVSSSGDTWYKYKATSTNIALLAGILMMNIRGRLTTIENNLDHCVWSDFNIILDLHKSTPSDFCKSHDLVYNYADVFEKQKYNNKSNMTIAEYMDQECREKSSTPSVDAYDLQNSENVFKSLKNLYQNSDDACRRIYNMANDLLKDVQQVTPDKIRSEFNNDDRQAIQQAGMTEDQVVNVLTNKVSSVLRMVCQGCQTAISQVAEANKAAVKLINDKYAQTRKVINLQDKD